MTKQVIKDIQICWK